MCNFFFIKHKSKVGGKSISISAYLFDEIFCFHAIQFSQIRIEHYLLAADDMDSGGDVVGKGQRVGWGHDFSLFE